MIVLRAQLRTQSSECDHLLFKNRPGYVIQPSEDVARRRSVFATLLSSAEHATGHQQRQVVRAHEVLSEVDDGAVQGALSVVIVSLFADVPAAKRTRAIDDGQQYPASCATLMSRVKLR